MESNKSECDKERLSPHTVMSPQFRSLCVEEKDEEADAVVWSPQQESCAWTEEKASRIVYTDTNSPEILLSTSPCKTNADLLCESVPKLREEVSVYSISPTVEPMDVDVQDRDGEVVTPASFGEVIVDDIQRDAEGRFVIKHRSREDDPAPEEKLVKFLVANLHMIAGQGINPSTGRHIQETPRIQPGTLDTTTSLDTSSLLKDISLAPFSSATLNENLICSNIPKTNSTSCYDNNTSARPRMGSRHRDYFNNQASFTQQWIEKEPFFIFDEMGAKMRISSKASLRFSVSDSNIDFGRTKNQAEMEGLGIALCRSSKSEQDVSSFPCRNLSIDQHVNTHEQHIETLGNRKRSKSDDSCEGSSKCDEETDLLFDAQTLRKSKRRKTQC